MTEVVLTLIPTLINVSDFVLRNDKQKTLRNVNIRGQQYARKSLFLVGNEAHTAEFGTLSFHPNTSMFETPPQDICFTIVCRPKCSNNYYSTSERTLITGLHHHRILFTDRYSPLDVEVQITSKSSQQSAK